MQILKTPKNLFHYYFYFKIFIQFICSFLSLFSDELSKSHIHFFKNNIQFSIFIFNFLCPHYIRRVLNNMFLLLKLINWYNFTIMIVKLLQNLNFSLLKSNFFGIEFVFKLFDCKKLSSFSFNAFENLPKTTLTNAISKFIFIPYNVNWFIVDIFSHSRGIFQSFCYRIFLLLAIHKY